MKSLFIQANCIEGNRVDLRQANVVKKYKPDIILFEMPAGRNGPALVFNKFSPKKKPFGKVAAIKKRIRVTARTYPYAMSDLHVWENIEALWREGHNTLLFNVDGSKKLRAHHYKTYGYASYATLEKNRMFWAYLLVRDRAMAKNIKLVLRRYAVKKRKRPVVAVFLQSIHWGHVRFLLTGPSERAIWKYYFGRFPGATPESIGTLLKKEDKALYGYWLRSGNMP